MKGEKEKQRKRENLLQYSLPCGDRHNTSQIFNIGKERREKKKRHDVTEKKKDNR